MYGSEPQYAVISAASSGDNTLVAAVTGKKIRVLSFFFSCAGAVVVRFESNAGGTALTGVMSRAGSGWASASFNPEGWFQTAAGQLLNLELSAAVQVSGALTYVLVD